MAPRRCRALDESADPGALDKPVAFSKLPMLPVVGALGSSILGCCTAVCSPQARSLARQQKDDFLVDKSPAGWNSPTTSPRTWDSSPAFSDGGMNVNGMRMTTRSTSYGMNSWLAG